MSIEALLVVVFLLLPLLDMFRAAAQRRKEQKTPEPTRRPVPPRQTPRPAVVRDAAEPTAPPPVPATAVPDPTVAAGRETMSDRIAARRAAKGPQAVAGLLRDAAARRRAHTIHEVVRGLHSPGGVHRAMVAMTILGPCRAVDPYGSRARRGGAAD